EPAEDPWSSRSFDNCDDHFPIHNHSARGGFLGRYRRDRTWCWQPCQSRIDLRCAVIPSARSRSSAHLHSSFSQLLCFPSVDNGRSCPHIAGDGILQSTTTNDGKD